ncbi:MAG: pyruvate kinase [Candidatus Aenigmarchaeota archaeon]|nr:pyruvate kinase [Candidatus Aenigmarchaeota archaeon]
MTTSIIATIGPASQKEDIMLSMAKKGMNIARINFSHETIEIQENRIDTARRINEKHNMNIKILVDLRGPEVRISNVEKAVKFKKGDILYLSRRAGPNRIKLSNGTMLRKLVVGSTILIDDGNCEIKIVEKGLDGVKCEVLEDCVIKPRKSVAAEFVTSEEGAITEFDKEIIKLAVEKKVDYLALSHVKSAKDVEEARQLLGSSMIKIISKIENHEAVENIEAIVDAGDGIMIARGDLGVNVPIEYIPLIQEQIVKLCNRKKKFCIVATQMMESMLENKRPSRADVNDVYTAVVEGADAVMLSGETTLGKFPIDVVTYMKKVTKVAQDRDKIDLKKLHKERHPDC